MATSKILIAKQRSRVTVQIKTRLSRLGYKVTGTVSTLPAVFSSIAKKQPDVLLLDLGIKSHEHAMKAAREIRSSFDIPVVLLAGDTALQPPALISDLFEYVYRPFRAEELHTAIELARYKHGLKKQGDEPEHQTSRLPAGISFRASEELFSKAFHANPSGMIITRMTDGKILDVNASYQQLLGYTAEELIGNTSASLNIRNHPEERQALVTRLQWDGPVRNHETTLCTKSGRPVHVLFSLERIELAGEQCILASVYDVTGRKQAEEKLRARERFYALLNRMTRSLLQARDFKEAQRTLAAGLAELMDAEQCTITLWPGTAPTGGRSSQDNKISLAASVLKAGRAVAIPGASGPLPASLAASGQPPARPGLGIPLIAGEHKLGAALLSFPSSHTIAAEEIEQAELAGSQAALALWNLQQSVEIIQQLKQSRTLTGIGRALSEMELGGSERVLQLIVDSSLDLIPKAEQAVIHIVDAEENVLRPMAIAGYSEKVKDRLRINMQMGKGVAGQVIRDGTTINIPDVDRDPRFLRARDGLTFRSLMVAPIQSGRKQIGTISIQSKVIHAFSPEDEQLLNALAIDAAIAIDNTRSFETTQQRLKEVNALYGTIKVLAASLDAQQLADDVVNLLQKNFGYYYVQLFHLDTDTGDLVLRAGSGEVGKRLLQDGFKLSRGMGIVGHAAETGTLFFANHVNDVVFFLRNPLLPDTQSELAVPIKIGQDVVGVLDIQDKPPKQFSTSDLQLVQAVGDQLAVALHKANLYTDLQNTMEQEQSIRSQLVQSERLALVGRLLASVSHELNNPLQAIQNALFLLKEETGISPQGRQDLGIVLSETERMAALIERLRSAYRPIRGKDFQPIQLNNLIEDVYALIGTHMRHKDIAFEFIPEADLQPVSGISDQLRQVVLNLFLNAVEVMQPGGRLTAQTRNLIGQREVLFSIKDTGPGIDAEILPRIFDAFITNKHTGTGLGLTITHDILQQHHGRIAAENDPQGGATFHVWLPMCDQEP